MGEPLLTSQRLAEIDVADTLCEHVLTFGIGINPQDILNTLGTQAGQKYVENLINVEVPQILNGQGPVTKAFCRENGQQFTGSLIDESAVLYNLEKIWKAIGTMSVEDQNTFSYQMFAWVDGTQDRPILPGMK